MTRKYTRRPRVEVDCNYNTVIADKAKILELSREALATHEALMARSKTVLASINTDTRQACEAHETEYKTRLLALQLMDYDHLGANPDWAALRDWRIAERNKLSEQYQAKIQMWFDCFAA